MMNPIGRGRSGSPVSGSDVGPALALEDSFVSSRFLVGVPCVSC